MTKEFLNTELKPYSELTREEKHILLDAVIDSVAEVWQDDWEVFTPKTCPVFHDNKIYRTKPKEYKKLDIPWQVIDEKWKYAASNSHGIWMFQNKPTYKNVWYEESIDGAVICVSEIFKLDTTGIVAEHSLTQRPTGSDTMRPEGV